MPRKGSVQAVGVFVGPPDMEPLDVLGSAGSALWGRVWAANDGTLLNVDASMVQMLCESVDERSELRERVASGGDWRDRVALRTLDAEISKMLHLLGLDPTARARLGSRSGPAPAGVLDELRARRRRE